MFPFFFFFILGHQSLVLRSRSGCQVVALAKRIEKVKECVWGGMGLGGVPGGLGSFFFFFFGCLG